MNTAPANISSDRRHFFMSSAQLEALERREQLEKDPVIQKLGSPLRTGARVLSFDLCDEGTVVLGLANHHAKVADLKAKECSKALVRHSGPVTSVAVCGSSYKVNGSRIALSGSWDKTVKVWSVDQPQRTLAVLSGHLDFVKCLAVHPALPIVYTGSADKTIMLWKLPENPCDLVESEQVLELRPTKIIKGGHNGQIYSLCLDPSTSSILYSAGSDASVRAWNALDGSPIKPNKPNSSVLANDQDEFWQIPRGQHQTNIFDLKATEYSLWTASADNTAVGWDVESLKADFVLEHKTFVTAVLPIPQAGIVVTGTRGGMLYVWRTGDDSAEIIREIHAHTDDVTHLQLAGRMFYSSGLDETLRVWNMKEILEFSGGISYIPAELAALGSQGQDAQPNEGREKNKSQHSGQSMLTEEEERELAELMSDIDDM